MIRLIGRRLIIPQGDTGEFTIPTQGEVSGNDIAIFAIYDNLTHQTVLEKKINATPETLTFVFASSDTLNIEPDDKGWRYSWDIILKRNPGSEQETTDSYYAAYSLPPCIIKRVTYNVYQ